MTIKPRVGDEFFTHCPRKHPLPHRVPNRGRCTPDECCVAGDSAHAAVKQSNSMAGDKGAEARGFAEETERLLDARGRMMAWDELHPLPKVATAPTLKKGVSVFQYLRERTAQAAPLALERIIRKALMTPGPAGDAAADNLLDRFGYSRRGDAPIEFNGPVSIINMDPRRIPLLRQKTQGAIDTTHRELPSGEQVHGEEAGNDDVDVSSGDDGAGDRTRVREAQSEEEGGGDERELGDAEE